MRPIYNNTKSTHGKKPKSVANKSISASEGTCDSSSHCYSSDDVLTQTTTVAASSSNNNNSSSNGWAPPASSGSSSVSGNSSSSSQSPTETSSTPESFSYANIRRFFNGELAVTTKSLANDSSTGLEEHLYDRIDFKQANKRLLARSGIFTSSSLIV